MYRETRQNVCNYNNNNNVYLIVTYSTTERLDYVSRYQVQIVIAQYIATTQDFINRVSGSRSCKPASQPANSSRLNSHMYHLYSS